MGLHADFIYSTFFFEIIVGVSISMDMVPFLFTDDDFLGSSDKMSVGFALLFTLILVAYMAFVAYFICCKSR